MPKLKHKLGSTYYELHGANKRGTPLVCLNGGPGGALNYYHPLKSLGRPVLLYDQIGTGRSSKIAQRHQTVKTLTDDLVRLMKHLDLGPVHVLGCSWGGALALEYYLRVGNRGVASLVMQSPYLSTKVWTADANRLLKTMTKRQQRVIKACIEVGATDSKVYQEAEKAYYAKYVYRGKPSARSAAYRKKYPNPHGRDLYLHMWGPSEFSATGTLVRYEREAALSKIKCPTLFLCGQYDEATPAAMKRFSRRVPGSEVVVVRGGSHSLISEKPKEVIRVLNRFLSDENRP